MTKTMNFQKSPLPTTSMPESRVRTGSFGAGILAAVVVPPITIVLIVSSRLVGIPLPQFESVPVPMLVIWGLIFAFVLAAPVAFLLGAVVGRLSQRRYQHGVTRKTVLIQAAIIVAMGGTVYGAAFILWTFTGPTIWEFITFVISGAVAGGTAGRIAAVATLAHLADDAER